MLAALFHANIQAKRCVEIACFLPVLTSCFKIAHRFVEQGIGTDGVRQIEKLCIEAAAIDFESLFIERPGFGVLCFMKIHIRYVANRVGVRKSIIIPAVNLCCFSVVSAGSIEMAPGAGLFAFGDRFCGSGQRFLESSLRWLQARHPWR